MTSEAEIQPRPSVDDTGEKRFISDRTMREGADGLENVPSLEGGRPLPQNSSASSESRDATDEEVETLAHVTDNVPFAAWAVIFAGAAERFTYFGLIAPWQNYMQNPRGFHALPGALGLGQSTATNIYNAFFLFSFLTPVPFALVSDIWLGRYKTLVVGLVLYLFGCVVLLTTSLPVALDHGAGVGGLAAAFILVGLGVGSVKATFFPILGDQYIQRKPQLLVRKDGQRVIVDGPKTLQFIYNAYYWFTNIASLSSIPVTFLEKEYDFWAAYLLTTAAMCLAIVLFLVWGQRLVKVSPQGNVLPKAVKTLACAAKSGFQMDNAKPSVQQSRYGRTVPWTHGFVDEIKTGLVACRVIFSLLIFYLVISQMYNNLVSQAGQMTLAGIPNDMIQAFSGVACIIFGPIVQSTYDLLARRKIRFGPIARITTSFVFCGLSMGYAAGLQALIYGSSPCYDKPLACPEAQDGRLPNSVSVWLQMPVYFLLAVAEILGFVTAFEYSYSKAPRDMKAVVQALTQLTACLASLLGMAISPAAKDPNMTIMYACLAGAMGLSAVLFWWKFRRYDDIDRELNQFGAGDDVAGEDLRHDDGEATPGSKEV